LASKAIEFGEKTQNKGYYAIQGHFKVIEVGINRRAHMRLSISD